MGKVGILGLQGDFAEHEQILCACGVEPLIIRSLPELNLVNRLIIPGGESTTMNLLLTRFNMGEKLLRLIQDGMPVYGTCAGLIVLAKEVINGIVSPIASMNITAERNAYGRQVESFQTELSIPVIGEKLFCSVFIRAPIIQKVDSSVEVLAYFNDKPVMARENNLLVSSFHPELTEDLRIHRYFLKLKA